MKTGGIFGGNSLAQYERRSGVFANEALGADDECSTWMGTDEECLARKYAEGNLTKDDLQDIAPADLAIIAPAPAGPCSSGPVISHIQGLLDVPVTGKWTQQTDDAMKKSLFSYKDFAPGCYGDLPTVESTPIPPPPPSPTPTTTFVMPTTEKKSLLAGMSLPILGLLLLGGLGAAIWYKESQKKKKKGLGGPTPIGAQPNRRRRRRKIRRSRRRTRRNCRC